MKSTVAWLCVSALLLACGGATTNLGDAGGGDSGTTSDGSLADVATSDGGGGPDSGNGDSAAPCNAQKVNLTFTNCPAAPTCGGAIVDGTYDYTTGCIPDPWAQAKTYCPTMQVSNEQGTVQGCITFASGLATRDVQSSYSATLDVPSACLVGGTTCAKLQGYLAPYFTSATCSPTTGGCSCSVSTQYAGQGAVTYTTSNNQVVTSTNNHYDYCMGTGSIDMQWVSGPNPEPGIYTLTKQ